MAVVFGAVDFGRPARLAPRKVIHLIAGTHGAALAARLSAFADGWFAMGYLPERFHVASDELRFYKSSRLTALVDGDILNRASIAAGARIELERAHAMPLPHLIAEAFLRRGEALFAELDGSYRMAIWDAQEKRLLIATDRNSLFPLYYSHEEGRFLFASEVKLVLKGFSGQPGINYQAISDFISFGQLIDSKTFFKGIYQLPAGHFIRITEGEIAIRSYASEEALQHKPTIADAQEALEKLRNAALTGVKAYSSAEPTGIILTGGIDSRFILAAHKRLGNAPKTYSSGEAQCASAQLSRQAAAAVRSTHAYQELTPQLFLDNLRRTVWLSEGQISAFRHARLNLLPLLKNAPLRLLDALQPLDSRFSLTDLALWKYRDWNRAQHRWLFERIFPSLYLTEQTADALPRVTNAAFARRALPPTARLEYLAAKYDVQRRSAPHLLRTLTRQITHRYRDAREINMLRHYVRLSTPFYTFAYMELARSMSLKWLADEKLLIRKIIADLNETLARIPWQRTMLSLKANPALELTARGARLLNEFINFHPANREENSVFVKQPYFNFRWHLQNSPGFYQEIKYLLLGHLQEDFFSRDDVKKLLSYVTRYAVDLEALLGRIITVNLWYRYFIAGLSPAEEIRSQNALQCAA